MTPRQWLAQAQILDRMADQVAEGTIYSTIAAELRRLAALMREGAEVLGRRDELSVLIH